MIARAFIKQQESLTPLPPPGPRRMRLKKRGRRKSHVTLSLYLFHRRVFLLHWYLRKKNSRRTFLRYMGMKRWKSIFLAGFKADCAAGSSHIWHRVGVPGKEIYRCRKCTLQLLSNGMPSTSYCFMSGSHRWDKLGVRGNEHYTCRKCRMSLRTDGRPAGYGCSNNSMHLWHKL